MVEAIESFRSLFTVNVERSCDQKSYVHVHRKKVAVKVISDQRTCTILFPKPLAVNIHCKSLVVKEMLDQHTSVFLQPCLFSCMGFALVENYLLVTSTS